LKPLARLGINKGQPKKIPYGRHTYGPEPQIVGLECLSKGTRIGSFCSISSGVKFIFLGSHTYHWVTTYPFHANPMHERWKVDAGDYHGGVLREEDVIPQPIIVGNDVWIATNAKVKQGATIGDGAVVAMESLVTKDVPPYAIVGGNPARIIKYRFNERQIHDLLEIKWWNWDDVEIASALPLMLSEDIDAFIRFAKGKRDMLEPTEKGK